MIGISILIGLLFLISMIIALNEKKDPELETQTPKTPTNISVNASETSKAVKLHTLPGDYSTIVGIASLRNRPDYLISVHNLITNNVNVGLIKIWDLKDGSLLNSFSETGKNFGSLLCLAKDDDEDWAIGGKLLDE